MELFVPSSRIEFYSNSREFLNGVVTQENTRRGIYLIGRMHYYSSKNTQTCENIFPKLEPWHSFLTSVHNPDL